MAAAGKSSGTHSRGAHGRRATLSREGVFVANAAAIPGTTRSKSGAATRMAGTTYAWGSGRGYRRTNGTGMSASAASALLRRKAGKAAAARNRRRTGSAYGRDGGGGGDGGGASSSAAAGGRDAHDAAAGATMRVALNKLNMANGWARRAGRGVFHSVGHHTQVASQGSTFALHTFSGNAETAAALRGGVYNLAVRVRVPKESALPANERRFFSVVFGCTSTSDYYCISANLMTRLWTIERHHRSQSTPTVLQSHYDDSKPTTRYHLLLQVRDTHLSVDVNDAPFFTSVRDPRGSSMAGDVGVGALRSRFTVTEWAVFPPDTTYEAPQKPPPGVRASRAAHRGTHRGTHGDSGSSNAGLPRRLRNRQQAQPTPIRVQAAAAQFATSSQVLIPQATSGATPPQPPARRSPRQHNKMRVSPGSAAAAAVADRNPVWRTPPKTAPPPSLIIGAQQFAIDGPAPVYNAATSPGLRTHRRVFSPSQLLGEDEGAGAAAGAGAGAGAVASGGGAGGGAGAAVHSTSQQGAWAPDGEDAAAAPAVDLYSDIAAAAGDQGLADGDDRHLPRFVDADDGVLAAIEADILDRNPGVSFDDIACLDSAKRMLNEAVALPLLVPEMFTGIREPWRGVLLFGPPGTGKTMLAKAVASMNGVTFFNCSAASLVTKWRGESEKMVRCLFGAARHYAPSIVFIDEIDALLSARGDSSEHEASRRLKTEFLVQMDGVPSAAKDGGIVVVLATTNRPWDLDQALRRRLEKRIYVPMPDLDARMKVLALHLADVPTSDDVNLVAFASMTEGYSGADLQQVCREACMVGVRRLLAGKTAADIATMRAAGMLSTPTVTAGDLLSAIASVRPSVGATDLDKFVKWDSEFGSK